MSNVRNRLAELSSEEIEIFLGQVPRLCLEGGKVKNLCYLLSDYDQTSPLFHCSKAQAIPSRSRCYPVKQNHKIHYLSILRGLG